MKHYYMTARLRTSLGVLMMLFILVLAGCTIGPVKIGPTPTATVNNNDTVDFSNAFPPSTPLVCPSSSSNQQNSFVQHNGTQFIYKNAPLKFFGFTFYPSTVGGSSAWRKTDFTHYIDHILDLGAQAGQNLVRPTDFWDINYHDNKQDDITVWKNMDYLVCTAQQRGMFVVMDVSAFGWFIVSQKHDRFNAIHWKLFLDAVGKHYSNQSAIAFYSIIGEPDAPKSINDMNKLVDFYRTVTDDLRAADANHLIMAGGFNHMEDESPQLPWWQRIYALPNNDIVGYKTYSQDDLNLIPTISQYAGQLGKPMVDEEFGLQQDQGDGSATGQVYNGLQISRAQFYNEVYNIGEANGTQGFVFWNLGCEMADTSYEVSPNTPAVWQVVQQHAPQKLATPASQPACPT
jgi:hypothetical protein